MFSFWHMVNIVTQVVVKKGLEARPVGLRVSLCLCLCPEEQPALPAAVADCFPTLPTVSAAQITPSGADPPERGNAETDVWGEEGRKREKRMGKLQIYILGFMADKRILYTVDGMFADTCMFEKMDSTGMRRDWARGVEEVIWFPSNRRRNSLCLLCSSFRRLLS